MKWLRDRIHGREPRPQERVEEQAGAEPATPDPTRPRLMLLVHDAAAPASYRLHTFEDASSAQDFVQFWFSPKVEHGILAFWALQREPVRRRDSSEERPAEVVLLIRDEARPEIVYPFSLPDMELARSWLVKEMARGLNLRSVRMRWAAPVKIGRNRWGTVRITPAEPPPTHRSALLRSPTVIVRKDETPRREADLPPQPKPEGRRGTSIERSEPFGYRQRFRDM